MITADKIPGRLLLYQRNEITEHHVYRQIARTVDSVNGRALEQIAA